VTKNITKTKMSQMTYCPREIFSLDFNGMKRALETTKMNAPKINKNRYIFLLYDTIERTNKKKIE
jgi:hypothetical protein